MDIRIVRALLAAAVFAVAGCDGPEPAGPPARDASAGVPAAVRYDQYGAAGEVAPPAEDLVNPLGADPAAVSQGETVFSAMNCDGCHGGGGFGAVGPSLADGRWRYGGDDGALFHSIFYGRPRGMPAYGGMLPASSVWQLVSYVRSQPANDAVPTTSWP